MTMDRRSFLRSLAATVVVAPRITYVLPPPGGWRMEGSLWATNCNGNALWVAKTPEEILADVNAALYDTWNKAYREMPDRMVFMEAQLEVLDHRLVRTLRKRRGRRWFL